jgi:uncharacterized protein (TIGR03435 family)
MVARLILSVVALAVTSASGQTGTYGPVATHLKAGDDAPDITFKSVLSAPGGAQWNSSNLTGRLSILILQPIPSQRAEIVTEWNALVDAFANLPVQFLFVTGEGKSSLIAHPIKGWVFYDPDGKTGNDYSLEFPQTIFIGADGKIMGFYGTFPPDEAMVNSVLEGRFTTTPFMPSKVKASLGDHPALLSAEPSVIPPDDKPKFPPSYELHILPSPNENKVDSRGPNYRALRHATLREAIASFSDLGGPGPFRLVLPPSLDTGKFYDFSLILPEAEDSEQINSRIREGIEDYFHLTARREDRLMDVYVVTVTPDHTLPVVKPRTDGSHSSEMGLGFDGKGGGLAGRASLTNITSMTFSGSMDEFCRGLEGSIDRPVINETHLDGLFAVQIEGKEDVPFPERLREQYSLEIAPDVRSIQTLIFEPR